MAAAAELGCARGAVVLEAWRYVAAPATGAEPEPEPLEGLMAGAAPCAETDPATSRGPGGGCAGPRRRAARTKPTGVGWDGPGTGRRRAEGCVVSPGRGGRSDGGRTGAGLATPQQDEVAPLARAGLPRRGAPRGRPLQQPGASFVSPPRGFPARHADAKPTDGRPPGTALAGPDLGSRGSERHLGDRGAAGARAVPAKGSGAPCWSKTRPSFGLARLLAPRGARPQVERESHGVHSHAFLCPACSLPRPRLVSRIRERARGCGPGIPECSSSSSTRSQTCSRLDVALNVVDTFLNLAFLICEVKCL